MKLNAFTSYTSEAVWTQFPNNKRTYSVDVDIFNIASLTDKAIRLS